MSNQQLTETEDKPFTNSWRARIRKSKGFVLMVDDFVMLFPEAATNPVLKKRIEDNCETLWKLGAAEHCGNGNGKAEPKKKIENEPVLTVEPTAVSIQSAPEPVQDKKNKAKKTSKKACDC